MSSSHHQAWTIEGLLQGKPMMVADLFQSFMAAVQACGPVEVEPTRDRVVLHGRQRIFASIRPTQEGLRGHLNLPRRVDDPRLYSVEPLTRHLFFHRFRLSNATELDETFVGWLHESYAIGQGAHRQTGSPPSS
jgi:hypothetical protein